MDAGTRPSTSSSNSGRSPVRLTSGPGATPSEAARPKSALKIWTATVGPAPAPLSGFPELDTGRSIARPGQRLLLAVLATLDVRPKSKRSAVEPRPWRLGFCYGAALLYKGTADG